MRIMNELFSARVSKNIYATARAKNDLILHILKKFGFAQNGNAFQSNEGDYSLVLYIKKA